jgi:dimethylhistidine N-methyltransferase
MGAINSAANSASRALKPDAGRNTISDDVAAGLLRNPKSLPPKLFYDAEGSALFEQITELPEYYLTRTELQILETHSTEMLTCAGSNLSLVELGAGTATKTGTLIRALLKRQLRVEYYPIDICPDALEVARGSLTSISPRVRVHPVNVDYTQELDGIHRIPGQRLALYLGSSIGNFEQHEAIHVLQRLRARFQPGDAILLGADSVKSASVLQPAYDDCGGVTARFNKNMLSRINRELGGKFHLEKFRHIAEWNPALSRMEMYLESTEEQSIPIDWLGIRVSFAKGERIHTENSHKFTTEMVRTILGGSGFELEKTWTDPQGWFSVHLARVSEIQTL